MIRGTKTNTLLNAKLTKHNLLQYQKLKKAQPQAIRKRDTMK